MTSTFADALRELGVDETLIYQEAFFNGHLRGERHEVAELRTRLSGGLRLSPVITGGVELFPLQRPLTHPRERLAS
jgi:hypothetical protein